MFASLKEKVTRFMQLPFFTVKADDEELVDPAKVLREKCEQEKEAQERFAKLQECNSRVLSKKETTESCAEELWDFLEVVDKCISKDLFKHLK
ncbi:cytochrome b-c1 complex subunit 6, mitochondrial-like [Daktulosphaira vitifoliae]|uniref:cytochrome b-c1 complex subunit 6, mitochondrial-like n=1 Tax=Daktulosphaira vitifoliae TaxID=58002 RepID=UPI0021AA5862|nr:cytochrome b-c1 complex subunit 6, mitochondrial-like [Daktulosphaira vitifoliae]